MKSKQEGAKSQDQPERPGPQAPATVHSAPSRRRRRWFRLAALAAPLAGLLLLEGLLRLGGYGYPAGFFLQARIQGRDMFVENPRFSQRFFPPGLERASQPLSFPAAKPPGTIRIFVFGESAAMGDPEPAFGFARVLEVLLREALPGKKLEVINVAVTAINSHVVREIAKDCADKQGDYWIVYMGNNEVVGPFGAGTIFGEQTPGLGLIRAQIALKRTRVGQLLESVKLALTRPRDGPTAWEGMEMFLRQQVAQDDPRMARVYRHFGQNLNEIIRLGEKSGAKVLLSTVVCNLKDFPPFASQDGPSATNETAVQTAQRVASSLQARQSTNVPEALKLLEGMTHSASNSAGVFFHAGRGLAALGRFDQARPDFERARDLDTLRFRADTAINQLIRQAATDDHSVKLVDAVERVAKESPERLTGGEFLYEHVHFNFPGNYLLATAFAEQILAGGTNRLLSADECGRRLAFTDHERARVLEEVLKRLQKPPFATQFDAAARERQRREQLEQLRAGQPPETWAGLAAVYRDAITGAPEDWVLREIFARFLQDAGESKGAEEQWRQVIELLPHHAKAWYGLADALDAQGRAAEAVPCFQEALRRRPGSVEVRNGLGLALANEGRLADAIGQFELAIRQKPTFAEAHVNLGQILAQQGQLEAALAQYIEALRDNSNHVAAHVNLGKVLAAQGKTAEAAGHYRAALQVQPSHAVAHFNLGNLLLAAGDSEAMEHFAAAVKSNPNFAEAHYNLALELAKRGQGAEALAHFAAAARLKPGAADLHFNYGVALARAHRYDEAATQFREALRLEPTNEPARKFLDQARALEGR